MYQLRYIANQAPKISIVLAIIFSYNESHVEGNSYSMPVSPREKGRRRGKKMTTSAISLPYVYFPDAETDPSIAQKHIILSPTFTISHINATQWFRLQEQKKQLQT